MSESAPLGPSEEHGTCAIAAMGKDGLVFAVDSLQTLTKEGMWSSNRKSCKVHTPRPDVLVVAVGLASQSFGAGFESWDSLGEAFDLVNKMPKVVTFANLSNLSVSWRNSYSTLVRKYNSFPPEGLVAELFIITRVNGVPMIQRSSLVRQGKHFHVLNSYISFTNFTGPGAHVFFSGLCRQMITKTDEYGHSQPPTFPLSQTDQIQIDAAWSMVHHAQESGALSEALIQFEKTFTAVDQRQEGPHAAIGEPYAWARFDLAKSYWETHFNDECYGNSTSESRR